MGPAPLGVPNSPRCPQLPRVSPAPPGAPSSLGTPFPLGAAGLELAQGWGSLQRATGPCLAGAGRTKPRCVLNAPRRARRRGGRAWPSPGMGTLLGGVPAPREAARPPLRAASSGRSPGYHKGTRPLRPGVSGTEGGGRGGAMPGGTGRAVVPSGYLQEENASKNHLLTLKLTSLLGIEAPKGKTVLGRGGEE